MDIKKLLSNKKRNTIIIILMILLLLDLVMGLICRHVANDLSDQQGARRWAGDESYAQVSLFFTEDQMVEPNGIKRFEYNLGKKMQEAGIIDDDEADASGKIVDTVTPGRRPVAEKETEEDDTPVYTLCYSAQGISTLSFEKRTAENIPTIGVDGDFFLFHPLELVSGSYFGPDDIMKDKIVLDEDLAWDLFGSSDIIGECVNIGGISHYVSGVVKRQDGRMNRAAGLSKNIVFMSYESLAKYGSILSGKTESREISEDGATMEFGGINCIEVIMPDPVSGVALRIIRESAGVDERYISVIDNTNRFSFLSLIGVLGDFGKRSMWDKPVFYPYWENVARGWEDVLAVLALIRIICLVLIAAIITVCAVNAYRNKTWTVRGIIRYLADKKYDYEAEKQARKRK